MTVSIGLKDLDVLDVFAGLAKRELRPMGLRRTVPVPPSRSERRPVLSDLRLIRPLFENRCLGSALEEADPNLKMSYRWSG